MQSKPDLKGTPRLVLEYIEQLEKELAGYKVNGAVKYVASINRKLHWLADKIDCMNIDLEDPEDKTLDRFLKMAKEGNGFVSGMKSFTQEYGNVLPEETNTSIPLIEKMFNKKPKDGKAV